MTTHFAGKFKGKGIAVPYCKQWAFRVICGTTTTDKTQVTCKTCCKKLNITPAASLDISKNRSGICACCFNSQKVKPTGTMFKHGYTRPGYGYVLGGCPGDIFPSYEISVQGTVHMLNLVKNALVRQEAALESLKTATTITVTARVYRMEVADYVSESFVISADDQGAKKFDYRVGNYVSGTEVTDSRGATHFFNFAKAVVQREAQLAQEIKDIKSDIAFFEDKVASWVKTA